MENFSDHDLFVPPPTARNRVPYVEIQTSYTVENQAWSALLADLFFLTRFWNSTTSAPGSGTVVYASEYVSHLSLLAQLFPQLNFEVYTPTAPSREMATALRIRIAGSRLTLEDVRRYEGQILIHSVRTLPTPPVPDPGDTTPPHELEQLELMRVQYQIYLAMQPRLASLRFKPPYARPPSSNPPQRPTVEYIDGYLLKELWGSKGNAETRLIPLSRGEPRESATPEPPAEPQKRQYHLLEYQEQMAYHNQVVRQGVVYANPLSEETDYIYSARGLTNDFDSRATVRILQEYLLKLGREHLTSANTLKLIDVIVQQLPDSRLTRRVVRPAPTRAAVVKIQPRPGVDVGLAALLPTPATPAAAVALAPLVAPRIEVPTMPSLPPGLRIGSSLPSPAAVRAPSRPTRYTREFLERKKNDELKAILAELNLARSGKKSELVDRILTAQEKR